MNDRDLERFESELRTLKPAQLPEDLQARLAELSPPAPAAPRRSWHAAFMDRWGFPRWLPWLAPAALAAAGAAILALRLWPASLARVGSATLASPSAATFNPDAVEIDRQLVASFDAVAELPGGEPVRFRCREWTDAVILRDPARGLEIERRIPRLEVVPVRFETY